MSIKIEDNPYAPLDVHQLTYNIATTLRDEGKHVPPLDTIRTAAERYSGARVTKFVPIFVYRDVCAMPQNAPVVVPQEEVLVFRR